MIEAIFVGVCVTLVAGAIVWLAKRFGPRLWAYCKVSWQTHDTNEAATKRDRRSVLIEQVEQAANDQGEPIASRPSGTRPRVVHWSDGTATYHFAGDLAAYRAAMQARRVPPTSANLSQAPRTIAEMSNSELEAWLREHA